MHLEDLKVMNRFEIMNNLENGKDKIDDRELSSAINILNERDIGIPKELLFQEFEYRAKTLGAGIKGYFIGTQLAWKSTIIFSVLSLIALIVDAILYGSFHITFTPVQIIEVIVLAISAYSVYVCRNNTKTNVLYILALLLVAQFFLRVMFATFVFSVPYIL